jgi:Ca-activated chloride channel family protein
MTRKKTTNLGLAILLIAALGLAIEAQAPEKLQNTASNSTDNKTPSSDAAHTVKVDVDLVRVNATVTEPTTNKLVTGLDRNAFEVYEDKIQQQIQYFSSEDEPISLGIIFDVSGSMKDKISTSRDAAVQFLKTGNPEDEYFLVEFSSRPSLAEAFTSDITRLQNHLIFTPAGGMTALYDAVYLGLEKLKEGSNPKKALLLITDGEDNHSRYTFANVKEYVKEQDVAIYGIGIVSDWNSQLSAGRTGRAVIEDMTDLTGGRSFFPDSVGELEDICTKIALELKNQYVLFYHSTNQAKNGKWRSIKMKINPPKGMPHLEVRAKSGYYAPTTDTPPRK